MLQTCHQCNAENSSDARFCDQCGAALAGDALAQHEQTAQPPAPKPTGQVASRKSAASIVGIFILVGVIAGLYLLLKPPSQPTAEGDPHSSASMMGGAGSDQMKKVVSQVNGLKEKLKSNPGDVDAVAEMYGLYGQVGKTKDVHPYLEKALATLEASKDAEGNRKSVSVLAEAAMGASDDDGLLLCLLSFRRIFPDEVGANAYLGDLTARLGRFDESIGYYSEYLEKAKADKAELEKNPQGYWDVIGARASVYLDMAEQQGKQDKVDLAITDLELAKSAVPKDWGTLYYLGRAYKAKGDKVRARECYDAAMANATDGYQRWRVEADIAVLEGKPEPPMPNPHAEGMPGGSPHGGASPHGGDSPHGGESPHGGMSGGTGEMPNDPIHQGAGGSSGSAGK